MKVIFDIQHLYYLPQYLPVIDALKAHNTEIELVGYKTDDEDLNRIIESALNETKLTIKIVHNWQDALAHYLAQKADWLVFGNAVADLEQLHTVSKTVLMQHGVGPKSCYYDVSKNPTTVRFVEGEKRLSNLQAMFPNGNFVDSGYAKLDPAINRSSLSISLSSLGLDESKPTILYAPTFYPSSIELFSANFASDYADYNVILKPHFFSLTKHRYSKQKAILESWAASDNVYLARVDEYNLLEFMAISDVMLSDASSAIFEFAALNKPVIWCDFYKLRWGYRGIFSFRFKKRIDESIEVFNELCDRAANYQELYELVKNAVKNPHIKQSIRKQICDEYVGKLDGKSAERICDYLISH
ncbi:CDP-glycerol glycerophosphotransferase family protein [Pseudoalteromonas piratica]|uniref:CDP-glycerol glycerophosphotransferase n=1 Tax=Pseudoalteromonas piratica TaxID=1348114 RepID=A0A0A7EFT3_9GAMM|nr:CDP-glycerol glycerophosphotransferase family protein [Pseudoalteromonas piratica]AIY65408.1 CDP-glycerol glycerophosphotransferase [Pseudoalteromonas piratica]